MSQNNAFPNTNAKSISSIKSSRLLGIGTGICDKGFNGGILVRSCASTPVINRTKDRRRVVFTLKIQITETAKLQIEHGGFFIESSERFADESVGNQLAQ
jgi:hypothetical protein